MKTNKKYQIFCELFNTGFHQTFEPTRAIARIVKERDAVVIRNKYEGGQAFHHMDAVTHIAEGLNLRAFVTIRDNEIEILVH